MKTSEPLTADQRFGIKLIACIVVAGFINFGFWLAANSSDRVADQSRRAIHQRHIAKLAKFALDSPLFDSAQITSAGHNAMWVSDQWDLASRQERDLAMEEVQRLLSESGLENDSISFTRKPGVINPPPIVFP